MRLCTFLFFLLCSLPVSAQDAGQEAARVAEITFVGGEPFSAGRLQRSVRTRANREIFGIPGATWWLWLYQTGERGTLGGLLSGALKRSGEPPAEITAAQLRADALRLESFFRREGYRAAEVEAQADTLAPDVVHVRFVVDRGQPAVVRSLRYTGLDGLPDPEIRDLLREAVFDGELQRRDSVWARQVEVQRFREPALLEERNILLRRLREEGFAAASRDSIRAFVRTEPAAEADSLDVTLRIRPGRRYEVGDVRVRTDGLEEGLLERDTLLQRPAGAVISTVRNEARLEPRLLRRTLQFEPGEIYDQRELVSTKQRLEGTGVFTYTDIVPRLDLARADTAHLPIDITLRTRPRHQIRLETFMLTRSGGASLGSVENELGTGLGLTYENVNAFGGGETLRLQATGGLAVDASSRIFTSSQAEISTALTFPYLVAPFRRLDPLLGLADARTAFSLSLLTARRDALDIIIRSRGTARLRLEMNHSRQLSSWVDLFDITLSNPDTLAGFSERFYDVVVDPVTDPVQRARLIEDYTQPQINDAVRYTLRSRDVNPLRRREGHSAFAAFEVGGQFSQLADDLIFTPDTLEGRIPGLTIDGISNTRLRYRPYVRLTGEVRRYLRLRRSATLALRATAGWAQPTGPTRIVPFDRRFYSGGATSVRGWRLRGLGPGGAEIPSGSEGADLTSLLGGDVKLEFSAEWRQDLIGPLLGARWIGVLFADAGNVWLGPRNPGLAAAEEDGRFRFTSFLGEVGVGTGIGVRAAWEYFIVRLDYAVRAYDPLRDAQGLFPDGTSEPRLHFGLGHTF